MKKALSFLLVVLMCFSLGACNSHSQTNSKTTEESGEHTNNIFSGVPEEVGFIVHISINPEFELYEDYGGYITELKCLNEDAEKAFANTDVVGMSNQTGIRELLNAAYNGGYLQNGATIEINCYVNDSIPDGTVLYNEIDEVLKDYKEIVDFTYSVRLADSSDNAINTFDDFLEVEKDADGNIIKTVAIDEQNRTVTFYYNTSGTVIREIIESADAMSDFTYNNDRILIKLEEHTADGFSSVREYNENGILIKQEQHTADGSYNIEEYHENGDLAYLIDTMTDEYHHEEYRYNAKGYLVQIIVMNESGAVTDIEMYARDENGSEISHRSYDATSCSYDSSYDEIEFDANGCVSKLIYTEEDTGYTETIYFTDGFYTAHEWLDPHQDIEDGWGYSYYDVYGNLTEIGWYDPAQRSFGSRIYNADGSYTFYGYSIFSDVTRHEVNEFGTVIGD